MDGTQQQKIIKIQSWFRGCMYRLKRLPLILYKLQTHLKTKPIQFCSQHDDGRINSCMDEDVVIQSLIEKFGDRIKKADEPRMWCDLLAFDYMYGWIPINVKTTMMKKNQKDNVGNLSLTVQAYTNEKFDIAKKMSYYQNGKMSAILFKTLKNKKYNTKHKKDYYFLVLNKRDATDIIVNSVKGLTILTPNINNLPFQVCWDSNRTFKYQPIHQKTKLLVQSLQKPKPSWKETFMANIRTLTVD